MYEKFYGLREKPFSLTPDPAYLYLSRQHRRAITALEYAVVNGSGFALLTGEVGSGKTMVLRHLLTRAGDELTVALISNTHPSLGSLLPWVAQAFGVAPSAAAVAPGAGSAAVYEQLVQFAIGQYAAGRRLLLIVDEAQNLTAAGLEELRLLSNINADKHLVIQTLLVGQPELRTTLQALELRQFAQRIGVEYHLDTLPPDEVRNYVRHRLAVAGGSPDLICGEAVELLYGPTCGVPRLINTLCDTALVYGYADQKARVDGELMWQAVEDRLSGSVLPLRAPEMRMSPRLRS